MGRKGFLFALGLACAAGLIAMGPSGGSPADEVPQIKLSIRVVAGDEPPLLLPKKRGNKWVVVANGAEGKEYDEINTIWYSPDYKRIAYEARQGKKWIVVADGVEGKEYDKIVKGTIEFSPDGRRMAYAANRGDKRVVVVDGIEGTKTDNWGPYEDIIKRHSVFSPDGKRVAYVAKRGKNWLAVVDGVEGKEYGLVRGPVFSPDGKRVAYWATLAGKSLFSNKCTVVLDGVEGAWYSDQYSDFLMFSADSRRIAYAVYHRGRVKVVVDGVEGKEYGEIAEGTFAFSPDSQHTAYGVRHGYYSKVVVDGVEGKNDEWVEPGTLHFSFDGKHLTYLAAHGKGVVMMKDGVEGKEHPGKLAVVSTFISPDSGRMAYWIGRGKRRGVVVEDEVEGKEYEGIVEGTPVFGPDGKHVAYCVQAGGKCLVVMDGVEVKETEFEAIFTVQGHTLIFDSPTKLHFYAMKNGIGFVRVDAEIGISGAEK